MSFNSERTIMLSASRRAKRKCDHLSSSINPGFKKYEPLLYKIGISFGFDDRESSDLLEQVSFHPNNFCSDDYPFGLKIWLSKIMVRKCIFRISNILFSNNTFLEIRPRVLGYYPYTKSSPCSCIQDMPLSLRVVYILKYTIEFDEIDIAEILNTTSIKVKDRFQKAKSILDNC